MRREFALSSAGMASAFEFIAETVALKGRDASVAHRLSVIVDEVCANAIRHDSSLSAADRFSLELIEGAAGMVLVICDPGRPFNPLEPVPAPVPDPVPAPVPANARRDIDAGIGGHGLQLIRGLATRVSYQRAGACNRLTVSIVEG
jgi:anti-sigma regulatory factor (Ser/Thr protein kinase)